MQRKQLECIKTFSLAGNAFVLFAFPGYSMQLFAIHPVQGRKPLMKVGVMLLDNIPLAMEMWAPVICWCSIYCRTCRETLPQNLSPFALFHHIICSELWECAFQNPISCNRAAGGDGMLVLQPGCLKITTGRVKPSILNACGLTRIKSFLKFSFKKDLFLNLDTENSPYLNWCRQWLLNDRVLCLLTSMNSNF